MAMIQCYSLKQKKFISKRQQERVSAFAETLVFSSCERLVTKKFKCSSGLVFHFISFLCNIFYSSSADPSILGHPINKFMHDGIGVLGIGHVYYHVYFNFFHGRKSTVLRHLNAH